MLTLTNSQPSFTGAHAPERHRWSLQSVALIVLVWLILQLGGIFSPGLLDDVDSIYIEVAREMLQRHDFVTPYIDGIRFFDKPPLMYWMASTSMSLFGVSDWAARLPLALAVLALFISVYALGNRLFAAVSPPHAPDRGGLYSALAVGTAIGPYLYTRFFIPDILVALWMTIGIHLFLIALERVKPDTQGSLPGAPYPASEVRKPRPTPHRALLPCIAFAAVLALNLLTKGLIGLVFPFGFVLLYLALTQQFRLLRRFHPVASILVFLSIALPWHILAALRNPAIALPAGFGLPARGGWAWFYLYNEHVARFLSRRIPHDYGQTPVWLFWFYLALWVMPWTTFIPSAIVIHLRALRDHAAPIVRVREHEAALTLLLWPALVLGFFTLSARQEYYSLPAIPALALMAGGLLAREVHHPAKTAATEAALQWSIWFLLPITLFTAGVCAYFAITAPHPAGATLSSLLATNPSLYNLSLGHLFDLTGAALGLFRAPLAAVATGLIVTGLGSTTLRWMRCVHAANIALTAGMIVVLLAAHTGLSRFNPILGSKDLAQSINAIIQPGDLILLDGELTTGSSVIFYARQQVHLVDGRVNGLWYGSFWADAPQIFETEASLRDLWASKHHVFLLTSRPAQRQQDLGSLRPSYVLAELGGKTVLLNFAAGAPR